MICKGTGLDNDQYVQSYKTRRKHRGPYTQDFLSGMDTRLSLVPLLPQQPERTINGSGWQDAQENSRITSASIGSSLNNHGEGNKTVYSEQCGDMQQVQWTRRERLTFLTLEGDLVVGSHKGLASEIALFLFTASENITKLVSTERKSSEWMKFIPERLERASCHFFRPFFGGLRVLSYQQGISEEREVIREAWSFLKVTLKSWHSVSMTKHIENVLFEKKSTVTQNFDWRNPHELLIYLLEKKTDIGYSETSVHILLQSFTKYFNEVESNNQHLHFNISNFQKSCREMKQRRDIHDALMVSDSYVKDDVTRPSKSSNGQSLRTAPLKAPSLELKKNGTSLKLNSMTWHKGKSLISNDQYLGAWINSYFSKLTQELCGIYFKYRPSIPQDHTQEYEVSILTTPSGERDTSQVNSQGTAGDVKFPDTKIADENQPNKDITKTGVNRAVCAARDWITPTFLGMVMVFQENKSDISSLKDLIEHACKFLEDTFSMWKEKHFRWVLQPTKSFPKAMFVKKYIDWPNSKEAFDFFLIYGNKKVAHMGYVWYLARRWQDLIAHECKQLKPSLTLV